MDSVDIFVIGGGINGSGIARDAAGRGLKVMLAEQNDYASGTSGVSSKLLHGGLRYLEDREYSLVRESLKERDTVAKSAPHLSRKLPFFLPIPNLSTRPPGKVSLGLKVYDMLAGVLMNGKMKSRRIKRTCWNEILALKTQSVQAVFKYYDYQTNDARLVMENIIDARQLGADVANYRQVLSMKKRIGAEGFDIRVKDAKGTYNVNARHIINAAGPWVNQVNDLFEGKLQREKLFLSRGSHIALKMPRPIIQEAFALQNPDGRTVFVMPWHNDRILLVGTTDEVQDTLKDKVEASKYEVDYLLSSFNRHLNYGDRSATISDIVWKFAGVRVLVDDGDRNPGDSSQHVRVTESKWPEDGSRFICVYGGRLTTYRALAERIINSLVPSFPDAGMSWTESAVLPGGADFLEVQKNMKEMVAKKTGRVDIRENILTRWAGTYGVRSREICDLLRNNSHLQKEFVPGVCEAELFFSMKCEDARSGEDFLFRRTQLHLDLSERDQKKICDWFVKYHHKCLAMAAE